MDIISATIDDAPGILDLQRLAYRSEAEIYEDDQIPPLVQTLDELRSEFQGKTFLKSLDDGRIIGSVRAFPHGPSCHIGRLIVHPEFRGRGIGSALMNRVESIFPDARRFELFTGSRSGGNLRLYRRLGYVAYREKAINHVLTLVYLEKLQ
jgi:ribosomal protein S18 acetylase RimI-like enzyme